MRVALPAEAYALYRALGRRASRRWRAACKGRRAKDRRTIVKLDIVAAPSALVAGALESILEVGEDRCRFSLACATNHCVDFCVLSGGHLDGPPWYEVDAAVAHGRTVAVTNAAGVGGSPRPPGGFPTVVYFQVTADAQAADLMEALGHWQASGAAIWLCKRVPLEKLLNEREGNTAPFDTIRPIDTR